MRPIHALLFPPGTEVCDAAGGAFRPECKEGTLLQPIE
jgi:hypothetical protein